MSYPPNWHTIYGDKTGESARRILPELIRRFEIGSVIEIGCGNAHWTRTAVEAGVTDYAVIDGPWNKPADLLVDPQRFRALDLSLPLPLNRRFDLAICLEVAEHVAPQSAEVLVSSLARAADVILFSAAIPLQGGFGHINEQWPSYWRDLFDQQGYEAFDLVRPQHWHDQAIHYWYRQNTLVYVARSNADATARAQTAPNGSAIALFDVVHPEKYTEMAGYEGIAFKRLARRLPGYLLRRLGAKLRGIG